MEKQAVYLFIHSFIIFILQFFGEYPAMGVHPLLLELHGSVIMTIGDAR